jgi:hypothetical protein
VIQRLDIFLAADPKRSKPLRRSRSQPIYLHKPPEWFNRS